MRLRSESSRETALACFLAAGGMALRLLPHPMNFTPLTAIALFSGMVLPRRAALAVPVAAMVLSDLVLGLHPLVAVTWGSFLLVALLGSALSNRPGPRTALAGTLAGSLFFFFTTNLAVFLFQDMYPKNASGLAQCFAMALPFFRSMLAGDLLYSAALFGIFAGVKRMVPAAVRS
ncbi:MAG TPA: DUF6580 family putative transport protein [Candidatus Eisenbacteria bacterium]|nr:DUF6580 family putative transport protein [Candidatus Eisenbacteria bacterium]